MVKKLHQDMQYHNVEWAKAYLHTKWHLDPSSRLTIMDMGRKMGELLHSFCWGGAGSQKDSQSNTMWPGPRATTIPSDILIYSTVWPQYTSVTDRQDRQRSDSIGRTVVQTLTQKLQISGLTAYLNQDTQQQL